jgi:plastocyanin
MRVGRWLALFALAPIAAGAAELRGQLTLYAGGQPLRASESADAVIYFRPRAPVAAVPAAEPATMSTRRKQFVPRVLPITAGSSVRFPNEDPILHNAFSTSTDNAFDTGQYGPGPGSVQTFNKPGLVKVYCNVHHSMFGFLLVLDTPYYTRPGLDGRFELRDLPEGDGDLVVYHDRATPRRETVSPATAGELAIRLDLNKRKVPLHMNKFGKPYRRNPTGAY